MIFDYKGNEIKVSFEPDDTLTEIRIVEQGIALLRNLLIRFKEVRDTNFEAEVFKSQVRL